MVAEHQKTSPRSGGWTGSRLMKQKSCKLEASSFAETITSCLHLFLTLFSNLHASFCSMPESGERHLGYVIYVHLKSEVLYLPSIWENSQTCSENQQMLLLQLHYSLFLEPSSINAFLQVSQPLYLSVIIFQKLVPALFFFLVH